MMRRRRLLIPQRRRIFLGCEGESERGYGALIGRFVMRKLHPSLKRRAYA
jgi:hypothetical protein